MKVILTERELKGMVKNMLNETRSYTTNNSPMISLNEVNAKSLIDRHSKYGYVIVSACRGYKEFGLDENNPQDKQKLAAINGKRTKEMFDIIKNSGFSFTPVYGGFKENAGTENEEDVYERSCIIYAHDKSGNVRSDEDLYNLGLELCRKYNQDSFLFKAPDENPKYITQNGDVDMEFTGETTFNDFNAEYFTDLHKHNANRDDSKPTRFSFNECFINPSPLGLSEAHARHLSGEIFVQYKK